MTPALAVFVRIATPGDAGASYDRRTDVVRVPAGAGARATSWTSTKDGSRG